MITKDEYYAEFMNSVQISAGAEGELLPDAFFNYVTELAVDAGELVTADRVYFKAQGLQVDGYGGDPRDDTGNESVLKVILSDFSQGDGLGSLTKTDIETLLKRGSAFVEKSLDESFLDTIEETEPAFGLADLIRVRWPSINRVHFVVLSNKILSARIKGKSSIRSRDYVGGAPVSYSIIDLGWLYSVEIERNGQDPIHVNLADYGSGDPVPVLDVSNRDTALRSYLFAMRGDALADIYEQYGTRLLEQNVRVFLQARGKVNKGIQQTIVTEPAMFFSYNNGLSATADKVEFAEGNTGLAISEISNLQIVNGGQTMASIHYQSPHMEKVRRNASKKAEKADLTKIWVQVKLTQVPSAYLEEIVPNISRFANTQNKVNEADFFANHPFHQQMEKWSRSIIAPAGMGLTSSKWYYERARGQYQNDLNRKTGAKRRQFETEYPKAQKFTKTDLAKRYMAWAGEPTLAARGAEKCFKEFARVIGERWDKNSTVFTERFYKTVIAQISLYKAIERMVDAVGGSRQPIVIYTVHKLVHDARAEGMLVDFDKGWAQQGMWPELREVVESIIEPVRDMIVNPPIAGKLPTEWAKSKECQLAIEALSISYPDSRKGVLLSAQEYKARSAQDLEESKLERQVAAETFVCTQEPRYWEEALSFDAAQDSRLLTSHDEQLMARASRGAVLNMSTKDKTTLFGAVERLKEAGFAARERRAGLLR